MSNRLQGELTLPGDKSISHRALMLLGISKGEATVQNLSSGQDVLSTLRCMRAMGAVIEATGENEYHIAGVSALQSPALPLDCGNSGTTIRLLSGLVSGGGINALLTGDESLQKRPMKRVITPLSEMGANIQALGAEGCAPLQITSVAGGLHDIHYRLPMASAQVKSAVLLAGLFTSADESIIVAEPLPSRDHTERMLNALGATVKTGPGQIHLLGRQADMKSQDITVPGDISSAAFWLVGAAILPGSQICLRQVGLNPYRKGVLDILQAAGVDIAVKNFTDAGGEPCGDLWVEGQSLEGNIQITSEMVPSVIDEIPILTVLGLFTDGTFTLRGAEELRFKEADRLGSLIEILRRLGVEVEAYEDGFSFQGNPQWTVPKIDVPFSTYHDHRLVMALEILNLRSTYPLPVEGKEWASISYPNFFQTLEQLLNAGSGVSG